MMRLFAAVAVLAGAIAADYLWEWIRPTLVKELRDPEQLAKAPRLYLASVSALFGGLAALLAYDLWLPSRNVLLTAAVLFLVAVGIGVWARLPRARIPHFLAILTAGASVLALLEGLDPGPRPGRAAWLVVGAVLVLVTLRTVRRIRAGMPAA
jgi:hypothetical protein